jgi:hypothetical protein
MLADFALNVFLFFFADQDYQIVRQEWIGSSSRLPPPKGTISFNFFES